MVNANYVDEKKNKQNRANIWGVVLFDLVLSMCFGKKIGYLRGWELVNEYFRHLDGNVCYRHRFHCVDHSDRHRCVSASYLPTASKEEIERNTLVRKLQQKYYISSIITSGNGNLFWSYTQQLLVSVDISYTFPLKLLSTYTRNWHERRLKSLVKWNLSKF